MRAKITVVGAGHVGEVTAQRLVDKGLGDVVLVDILEGIPQGKALDMLESAPVEKSDCHIFGTNDYGETADSDIVVITAGSPRKPGMSRDDLRNVNFNIVKSVTEEIAKRSPNAVLVVVSNPLDVMTYVAYKVSGFPRERVMGMAGILDTARFSAFIAEELKVSVDNIQTLVLGGHGDSMVPLARYSTVAGVPLSELLPKEKLDALIQRTRDGGIEIVNYLKTGSAYYAPSSAAVEMVDAILHDRRKILPCSAYLDGEYGASGVFAGVPVILGAGGIKGIFEVRLSADEEKAFQKSVAGVKANIAKLEF
jgi:malate dehydrogenase